MGKKAPLENRKILAYMYLWESFHKACSLDEFESRYVANLVDEGFFAQEEEEPLAQVVADFYDAHGMKAAVLLQDETVILEKRVTDHKKNILIEFICRNVKEPETLLFKVQGREDLTTVNREGFLAIVERALGEHPDKSLFADLVKNGVRAVFKLGERDAVIFFNDKIFIRNFDARSGANREHRFNGYPAKEMEELAEEIGIDYRKIASGIVKRLLEGEMDLNRIDNLSFHKNYIRLFQEGYEKVLKEYVAEKDLRTGLVNYVLRENFPDMVLGVAERLVQLAGKNQVNAKKLLNFYDGKEMIHGLKKVKKPEILAEGQSWNFSAIYNQLARKREAVDRVKKKEGEIAALQAELVELEEGLGLAGREKKALKAATRQVEARSEDSFQELLRMREELKSLYIQQGKASSPQEQERLNGEIETLKEAINQQKEKDAEAVKLKGAAAGEKEKLHRDVAAKETRIEGLLSKIRSEEAKLQNLRASAAPLNRTVQEVTKGVMKALHGFRL